MFLAFVHCLNILYVLYRQLKLSYRSLHLLKLPLDIYNHCRAFQKWQDLHFISFKNHINHILADESKPFRTN